MSTSYPSIGGPHVVETPAEPGWDGPTWMRAHLEHVAREQAGDWPVVVP